MANGSCVCGSLKYEFTGEPKAFVACHCIPCRKSSGADRSLNLMVPSDTVRKTAGEYKQHVRKGDSGKDVTYLQCDQCSMTVLVKADAMDGLTIVKPGTIDDQDYVSNLGAPKSEIYREHCWEWEAPIQGAELKSKA